MVTMIRSCSTCTCIRNCGRSRTGGKGKDEVEGKGKEKVEGGKGKKEKKGGKGKKVLINRNGRHFWSGP